MDSFDKRVPHGKDSYLYITLHCSMTLPLVHVVNAAVLH